MPFTISLRPHVEGADRSFEGRFQTLELAQRTAESLDSGDPRAPWQADGDGQWTMRGGNGTYIVQEVPE